MQELPPDVLEMARMVMGAQGGRKLTRAQELMIQDARLRDAVDPSISVEDQALLEAHKEGSFKLCVKDAYTEQFSVVANLDTVDLVDRSCTFDPTKAASPCQASVCTETGRPELCQQFVAEVLVPR